jgi:hypothetical protein
MDLMLSMSKELDIVPLHIPFGPGAKYSIPTQVSGPRLAEIVVLNTGSSFSTIR